MSKAPTCADIGLAMYEAALALASTLAFVYCCGLYLGTKCQPMFTLIRLVYTRYGYISSLGVISGLVIPSQRHGLRSNLATI